MTYPAAVHCPVCRFPTLHQSTMYEICNICWWEDDGRGDYDPAVEAARVRFADHGHMYSPQNAIAHLKTPTPERIAINDYLRSIDYDVNRADVKIWGPLLEADSDERVKRAFPNGWPPII